MTALDAKPAADSQESLVSRPFVQIFLPAATAVAIALTSFVTLAAYDKPLDRHALMPSVLACDDTLTTEVMPAVDLHADESGAHVMLLRFDLPRLKVGPSLL